MMKWMPTLRIWRKVTSRDENAGNTPRQGNNRDLLDQVQSAIAVMNSTLCMAQGRNEARWRPVSSEISSDLSLSAILLLRVKE